MFLNFLLNFVNLNLKNTFKKHKYYTLQYFKEVLNDVKHRVFYQLTEKDPFELQPLGGDKLPYPVNWNEINDKKKLIVELGTGHGELIEFLSGHNKDDLHVGFEITKKYAKKSFNRIKGRSNALVFKMDGYFAVEKLFKANSINKVYILFPDPWHKKRHEKRRPLRSEWLEIVDQKLAKNGEIFFATDWKDYYEFVLENYERSILPNKFSIKKGKYDPASFHLPETHYYKKWHEMGREFYYLHLVKND